MKKSKPFYKQVWFIIFIILVVISVFHKNPPF